VLSPLKVVIENWPEDKIDWLDVPNHPADPDRGMRRIPFSRVLWIERDDFLENPPRKFFRLGPGREVRLRYAYLVSVSEIVKDKTGKVVELRCKVDLDSRGGRTPDGRKVKGTIHWVSAAHAVEAEVRLYDPLFTEEVPGKGGRDVLDDINPGSLTVIADAKLEASLAAAAVGETVQFERNGYFVPDHDSTPDSPVYNRAVGLRDSWAKIAKM